MKFLPFLAVAVALLPLSAPAQSSVQSIMSEAQTAYIRGDIAEAKRGFELVLRADPRNQVAINYLRMIKVQQAKQPQGNATEARLTTVILPKVEFKDATLGAALDYLKQSVAKASDGKQNVSFVLQLPNNEAESKTVTLSLRDVPLTEALKYLGGLVNVDFVYDKYAVLVKPKAGSTAAQ